MQPRNADEVVQPQRPQRRPHFGRQTAAVAHGQSRHQAGALRILRGIGLPGADNVFAQSVDVEQGRRLGDGRALFAQCGHAVDLVGQRPRLAVKADRVARADGGAESGGHLPCFAHMPFARLVILHQQAEGLSVFAPGFGDEACPALGIGFGQAGDVQLHGFAHGAFGGHGDLPCQCGFGAAKGIQHAR